MTKRSLLALAVISCAGRAAAPPRPAESRELRMTLVPPVVGLAIEEDTRQFLEVTIGGTHVVERTGEKSRARVLAVSGSKIMKIATTYLEYTFDVRHGDAVKPVPPLAGHTYIVSAAGEERSVEREDGQELTDYERAAVLQGHKSLGKSVGSEALFASRPWRVGEAVELDEAQQELFLGEPSKGALAMKLVELTASAARFEMEGQRTYGDGVTFAVRGQLTLDPRTGRLVASSGSAQISGAWNGRTEKHSTWRETPPGR